MSGKWAILDQSGNVIGGTSEFPPSKIQKDQRISYKNTLYVPTAKGPVIEIVDGNNRASSVAETQFANIKVQIAVIAESPEVAQRLLDELLDKVGVRSAYEITK